MFTLICYKRCSTCQKAEQYLKDHHIDYIFRDIKSHNPNKIELDNFIKLSNKDIKSFFNTSGLVYKELELSTKLKDMSYDDKLNVLATNGMLVKRPILVMDDYVLVGFKKQEWDNIFNK